MSEKAVIQIIGAPVACAGGYKDSWRETAQWASRQLVARYGDTVRVEYFDLFDPGCPPVPGNTQLPLVFVNGEIVTNGGKISIPSIRKRLEAMGIPGAFE